jgi:glyoxylase-like metal-dependent hydrolase (beta-lactamase superfamily II)
MKSIKAVLLLACLGPAWGPARASDALQLQPVTGDVYAIVGDLGNRSAGNLGNNATFGLVVTDDGAVLIDAGGTERGARAIEARVREVTGQPVVAVINTGGQDHRWLGNDYFRRNGARIIASEAAVADQRQRARDQFNTLTLLVGEDLLQGTEAAFADETFAEAFDLTVGGVRFEIRHHGVAHTPGDSFVWLPDQRVMFTGDIVYTERMLGVILQSSSRNWIEVFDAMAAYEPQYVVPGHGSVTTLEGARRDTRDYLVFVRDAVGELIDRGGDLSEVGSIDQSRWEYLQNHEILAGRNAHQVFTEMEWE